MILDMVKCAYNLETDNEKTSQNLTNRLPDLFDQRRLANSRRDTMVDIQLNKLELQQARLNEIAEGLTSPVAVVLEGRDTAGKSGTIRALTQYLPPRLFSVVLSTKPSKSTMENWLGYWTKKMPDNGIVFYDRSWYSRALVQKINGWCSDMQYRNFMRDVESWEKNQTVRFGTRFVKFWLSISEEEQARRIEERRISPLKYWKLSPNDEKALSYYDEMTLLKEKVISRGGWETVDFNNKAHGRLELITRLNTILT